jgi:hypothetical protein
MPPKRLPGQQERAMTSQTLHSQSRRPAGLRLISSFLFLLAAGTVVAQDQTQTYRETLIDPGLPADQVVSSSQTVFEGNTNPDWLPLAEERARYYLNGFVGGSYADTPDDNFGGTIAGFDFSVPVWQRFGVVVGGLVNDYDDGTQAGGHAGVYKKTSYYGNFLDEFGASFLVHHWNDSGVGNANFVVGVFTLDYSIMPGIRFGVRYSDPWQGDEITRPIVGGGTVSGIVTPFKVAEGTIKIGGNQDHINFSAGHVEDIDSMVVRLDLARSITDRCSVQLHLAHYDHVDLFNSFLAVQVDLGPAPRHDQIASRHRNFGDIVRGAGLAESSGASSGESFAEDGDSDLGWMNDDTLSDHFWEIYVATVNQRSSSSSP